MIHEQPAVNATKALAGLLEARTGQQIAPSRYWRIQTALAPVLKQYGIPDLEALVAVLLDGKNESLFRQSLEAMLNNESFFFRDTAMFAGLRSQAFEALRIRRESRKSIRIWSAGCSTGQEAYSLAMMFADEKNRWSDWQIEITGTDISETVLEKARSGRFTQFEIQRGLSVDHMLRYFTQKEDEWCLIPEVQNMVRFRQDNLLRPSMAMGPYDLILCRNVLMYFGPESRHIAYSRLAKSIAHDGLLMLGAAETVIGHTEQFKTVPEFRGLYSLAVRTTAPSAN